METVVFAGQAVLLVTGGLLWILLVTSVVAKVLKGWRERGLADVHARWIVITGCDSGFGRGVVEQLVDRQARVIAFCYTPEGAKAALQAGARHAPVVDLTDQAALRAAAARVNELIDGELWGLVHNAGTVQPGFVEYQPVDIYRRVMEVNFFAPVVLTQCLLPSIRQGRGRVVVVSSVDGLVSLPGNAPYDASKFAVEAYADALRVELSLWGIPVTVINPSTMRTPLAMTFFEGHRASWQAMHAEDPNGTWQQHYPREWLETFITENTQDLERIAQDPAYAIADIVHALTSSHPRPRYLSGTTAKTLFWALWVAPEFWSHHFKRALIRPRPPTSGSAWP